MTCFGRYPLLEVYGPKIVKLTAHVYVKKGVIVENVKRDVPHDYRCFTPITCIFVFIIAFFTTFFFYLFAITLFTHSHIHAPAHNISPPHACTHHITYTHTCTHHITYTHLHTPTNTISPTHTISHTPSLKNLI